MIVANQIAQCGQARLNECAWFEKPAKSLANFFWHWLTRLLVDLKFIELKWLFVTLNVGCYTASSLDGATVKRAWRNEHPILLPECAFAKQNLQYTEFRLLHRFFRENSKLVQLFLWNPKVWSFQEGVAFWPFSIPIRPSSWLHDIKSVRRILISPTM